MRQLEDKDFFGMLMATVGTDMIGSVNFREVIQPILLLCDKPFEDEHR